MSAGSTDRPPLQLVDAISYQKRLALALPTPAIDYWVRAW